LDDDTNSGTPADADTDASDEEIGETGSLSSPVQVSLSLSLPLPSIISSSLLSLLPLAARTIGGNGKPSSANVSSSNNLGVSSPSLGSLGVS
jgi:hypothetical protein